MAAREQSPAILFVVRCFHPPELVEFRNYAQVVLLRPRPIDLKPVVR